MSSKLMTLTESVKLVSSGDSLAFGGNALHRKPMSFVRELARTELKGLHLINTAGAHDVDLLCGNEQVSAVDAGFISYESGFGLANYYRKAVQEGQVKGNEHACYTVISALRAAAYGVPFMPVRGLEYGDLLVENDYFVRVEDPFSGEPVTLVKALIPDVAIIHVQQVDEDGNAWIDGPVFDDLLLARASQKVIITAERVVKNEWQQTKQKNNLIPGFLVDAVVLQPKGAEPCSVYGAYDINQEVLRNFTTGKLTIKDYLADYQNSGKRVTTYGSGKA